MDATLAKCDRARVADRHPSILDEIHGARALGAPLVGDLDSSVATLQPVSAAYLAGFLLRLMVLSPSVSLRLVWRLGVRRFQSGARRSGNEAP